MHEFFQTFFPDYLVHSPKDEKTNFAYYRNDPKKISVVVHLPVVRREAGFVFTPRVRVRTVVKATKAPNDLFALADTMLNQRWRTVLKEKLDALEELVNCVDQCDQCGTMRLPKVAQKRETKTWFVGLCCPSCGRWVSTEYGRGLKRNLHRFLKERHQQANERRKERRG